MSSAARTVELAATLRRLRHEAGLSGIEAARRAGLSQPTVSRLDTGRRVHTPEEVTALCKAYRAPIDVRRALRDTARDLQLSEYLRYELVGYVESAAAGEEIRIADRRADPRLAELSQDFWLFDAETDVPFAALINYARDGEVLGFKYLDDAATLRRFRAERDLALEHSVALNSYLAAAGDMRHLTGD